MRKVSHEKKKRILAAVMAFLLIGSMVVTFILSAFIV